MTIKESKIKYNHSKKGKIAIARYVNSGKKSIADSRFGLIYRNQQRKQMLDKLGNECIECGFNDPRALQIDHIKGGGTKERREISPSIFYKQVMNDNGEHYQLLCANCNWIKRHEKNECKRRLVW